MCPSDPHSSLKAPSFSDVAGIVALTQKHREVGRQQKPQNHKTHVKNIQKMRVEMSQRFLGGTKDFGLNYKKFFVIWNIQQAHISHSQDNSKYQRRTEADSEYSKINCFPGFRGLLMVLFSQKWHKLQFLHESSSCL